jgi:hypothetical protein
MKRYACTVAAGLLLALASAGSATAGLPVVGELQKGTQSATFGDQTVGEQKNTAEVTQAQGNGNVNIAPAIAIFGDASTKNAQGNGNSAQADIDQSNTANQSQGSTQSQQLEQDGGSCCGGQSQTGEQATSFGDQTVGEQRNEATVEQYQGNGNVNLSPALAFGGKEEACRSKCGGPSKSSGGGGATTSNSQGNGNTAQAHVGQSNAVSQAQSSSQSQELVQSGGGDCCKPRSPKSPKGCQSDVSRPTTDGHPEPCDKQDRPKKQVDCCKGEVQVGKQSAEFGDQTVGEQKNQAHVSQAQGNKNANASRASGWAKGFCGRGASTRNTQGSDNSANADVDQGNKAEQSQGAEQEQGLVQAGKGLSAS